MTETVAIVDYGSGNLRSAQKALERAARESGADARIVVTEDAAAVVAADRVVLPGVGAFAACKAGLFAVPGLVEALEHAVLVEKRPFLGICVGMQLLATRGMEHGETEGLGWIAGTVRRLRPNDPALKVPHVGWNGLTLEMHHPCLEPLRAGVAGADPHAYFVHSYAFDVDNPEDALATCDYGEAFIAAVGRDNILGVQFHPEKSQTTGLALLAAFLGWRP